MFIVPYVYFYYSLQVFMCENDTRLSCTATRYEHKKRQNNQYVIFCLFVFYFRFEVIAFYAFFRAIAVFAFSTIFAGVKP